MSTKLLVALCEIEYVKGGDKAYAKAGEVIEVSADVYERIPAHAMRAPTDAEIALYEKFAKGKANAKATDEGKATDDGKGKADTKRKREADI